MTANIANKVGTMASALLTIAGASATAMAATLHVPSASYPTITSALMAAQPGDQVEIAAGTYYEGALNIPHQGIRVYGASSTNRPVIISNGVTALSTPATTTPSGPTTIVENLDIRCDRNLSVAARGPALLTNCAFYGTGSYAYCSLWIGGALENSTVNVENCTIGAATGNFPVSAPTDLYGAMTVQGGVVNVTGCTISGAPDTDGRAVVLKSGGVLTFDDALVGGGTAAPSQIGPSGNRGIDVYLGNLNMTSGTVRDCKEGIFTLTAPNVATIGSADASGAYKVQITNCSSRGIYALCSPTLQQVRVSGGTNSGWRGIVVASGASVSRCLVEGNAAPNAVGIEASSTGTPTYLKGNIVRDLTGASSKGIQVATSGSGQLVVDMADALGSLCRRGEVSNCGWGIAVTAGTPKVRNQNIKWCVTNVRVTTASANPDFGTDADVGNNNITEPGAVLMWATAGRTTPVSAKYNYWGAAVPPAGQFNGLIAYTPYFTGSVPDVCGPDALQSYVGMLGTSTDTSPSVRRADGFEVRFAGVSAGSNVRASVYDVVGRQVRVLPPGVNDGDAAVFHWDGRTEDATRASRGVYFVALSQGGFGSAKKIVVTE